MPSTDLKTIRDYIRWGISLAAAELIDTELSELDLVEELQWLILGSLNLPIEINERYLECNLTLDEKKLLEERLEQRIKQRIPTAYLLKETWFGEFSLHIDHEVKIPQHALYAYIQQQLYPWLIDSPDTILDWQSGTGAIAVACAHYFPDATILMTDRSPAALAVGYKNIQRYALEKQVQIVSSSFTYQLEGGKYDQAFDLIISCPASLSTQNLVQLPKEFRHQPKAAIYGGQDGIEEISILLSHSGQWLTANGMLVVDAGLAADQVRKRYPTVDFTWLENQQQQETIFLLSAKECQTKLQVLQNAQ